MECRLLWLWTLSECTHRLVPSFIDRTAMRFYVTFPSHIALRLFLWSLLVKRNPQN